LEIGYVNSMNLGDGFSTATLEVHPPALVDVTSTRDVPSAGGQAVYSSVPR
jgi:hypothetical protein